MCVTCPAGAYCGAGTQAAPASGSCPAGWYCGGNFAPPKLCPAGTWRSALGGSLISDCTPCVAPLSSTALGATSSSTCTNFTSQGATTALLLLLRVGDGVSCPDGTSGTAMNAACGKAGPVYIDSIDMVSAAFTPAAAPIPGISIAANDYLHTGYMTQCTDQTCVSFVAGADAVGTANTGQGGNIDGSGGGYTFAGDRVVVRITGGNTVDTSTRFTSTDYPGLPMAACSYDGSAFFVVGSTAPPVRYVPFGSQGGSGLQTASAAGTANPTQYSSCVIAGSGIAPGTANRAMYLARSDLNGNYGFADYASNTAQDWTQAGTLTIAASATYNGGPYTARSVLSNAAQSFFYVMTPDGRSWGIYGGPALTGMSPIYTGQGYPTGMALSPNEQVFFFTTRTGLFSTGGPSVCQSSLNCVIKSYPSATLPPFSEFRGVGVISRLISQCPPGAVQLESPSVGRTCANCSSGTWSAANSTSCSTCAAGSFAAAAGAAACTACPSSTYSYGGASACTICPTTPGVYVSLNATGQTSCGCNLTAGFAWNATALACVSNGTAARAAPFTPGSIVVQRGGPHTSGAAAAGAMPMFLDEISTAPATYGALLQSIAIPKTQASATGADNVATMGVSGSQGGLSRSENGAWLSFAGWTKDESDTVAPGTADGFTTVVCGANGLCDSSTKSPSSAASPAGIGGNNPRFAVTVDGASFWMAGTNGLEYQRLPTAAANAGAPCTVADRSGCNTFIQSGTNARALAIFGGELYVSCQTATPYGIGSYFNGTVGSSLVTSKQGATGSTVPGLIVATGTTPHGFAFIDANNVLLGDISTAAPGGRVLLYRQTAPGAWSSVATLDSPNGIPLVRQPQFLAFDNCTRTLFTLYTKGSGTDTETQLWSHFVTLTPGGATFTNPVNLRNASTLSFFKGVALAPGSSFSNCQSAPSPTPSTTSTSTPSASATPPSASVSQSCSPTDAAGSWSGAQPGVPGVSCSSCSGSNSATFTLACGPGYAVNGPTTGTCTYSKSCGKNTVIGICTSCQSCGYSASFSGTGKCAQCAPGSFKSGTDSSTSCTPCAAGSFQSTSGATSCQHCA